MPRTTVLTLAAAAAIFSAAVHADQLPTNLDPTTVAIALNGQAYTGTIPTEFGLLTLVTSTQLQQNTLTGGIPTQIGRMTATKAMFKVQQNSLSSSIPTQLGGLTALVGGSFFTNKLTGRLPTEIGQLTAVKSWFQGFSNLFTGSMPTEMGQMTEVSYTAAAAPMAPLTTSQQYTVRECVQMDGRWFQQADPDAARPTEQSDQELHDRQQQVVRRRPLPGSSAVLRGHHKLAGHLRVEQHRHRVFGLALAAHVRQLQRCQER